MAGVLTGVLAAAAAAAWYMSRSGSEIREQYQFEKKLGELGDEIDTRTRDIQIHGPDADRRDAQQGRVQRAGAAEALDDVTASAAEAAAEVAADVQDTAGKAKKAAKGAVRRSRWLGPSGPSRNAARMRDGSRGRTRHRPADRPHPHQREPVRKRKTNYPPAKTANRPAPATGAPSDAPYVRPTVATIDLDAAKGRPGLKVGGRVRIAGTGLYAGEIAVIEKLVAGVHRRRPSSGRRPARPASVRTIDLEPVRRRRAAGPAAAAAPDEPTASA